MKMKISATEHKVDTTEHKENTTGKDIATKESVASKLEKIREYIKEMHYRYQCYYKIEVKGWKYGYTPKRRNLRFYLTHTEEECKKTREQILAEARNRINRMDWQRIRDEEIELLEEERINREVACSNDVDFQ